jgi:hypothetical protein
MYVDHQQQLVQLFYHLQGQQCNQQEKLLRLQCCVYEKHGQQRSEKKKEKGMSYSMFTTQSYILLQYHRHTDSMAPHLVSNLFEVFEP